MTDTTKPATPELPPQCLTCSDSGVVGLCDRAEPCPDCTPADERELFEARFPRPVGVKWDGSACVVYEDYLNSYACERFVAQWTAWQAARAQLAAPQEPDDAAILRRAATILGTDAELEDADSVWTICVQHAKRIKELERIAAPQEPVANVINADEEETVDVGFVDWIGGVALASGTKLYTSAPASQAPTVAAHETQSVRDNAACAQPVSHNGIERLQTPMDALRWALDRIPESDRGDYWDRARWLADVSQAGPSDADKRDAELLDALSDADVLDCLDFSSSSGTWDFYVPAGPCSTNTTPRDAIRNAVDHVAAIRALAAAQGEKHAD